MKDENVRYLEHCYPFFRRQPENPSAFHQFGFQCEDGWFELIKQLAEDIKNLQIDGFTVLQIKEKFGGLRFYHSISAANYDPELENKIERLDELISKAETKSAEICEICGDEAYPRINKYWIKTLCDRCNGPK